MPKVMGLDHISIIVQDSQRSVDFYQSVLGLAQVARPELSFYGHWLSLGQGQTLHLMELPNPMAGVARPEHGGRDFHFALRVNSISEFQLRLEQHQVAYRASSSGRGALFFKDLDDNVIELFE